jgi:hypothetical protein
LCLGIQGGLAPGPLTDPQIHWFSGLILHGLVFAYPPLYFKSGQGQSGWFRSTWEDYFWYLM